MAEAAQKPSSQPLRQSMPAVAAAVFQVIVVLACAFGFFGCAVTQPETAVEPVLLPPVEQLAAAAAEDNGEYRTALQYWRQARQEIDARIKEISGQLRRISQWYAEIGARFYQEKKEKKALAEFIEALRNDPLNELALAYITGKYTPQLWMPYTVEKNDTIASIAEAVYGNAADAFAVVHFAGIDQDTPPAAGTEIRLPLLDSFSSPQLRDYKSDILRARTLYRQKNFADLLPLAERILVNHPQDEEASYLLNSALVGLGEQLRRAQKYEQANEVLSRVDPLFRDVKEDIARIGVLQEQQRAENAAARNAVLFAKATTLMEEDSYLEALSKLESADPEFEGVREALAGLRRILSEQADVHYKRGVTFFVDDNLSAAIDEWRITLRYDPDHEKAAANIAKARSLLEKVESID